MGDFFNKNGIYWHSLVIDYTVLCAKVVGNGGLISVYIHIKSRRWCTFFCQEKMPKNQPQHSYYMPLFGDTSPFYGEVFLKTKNLGNLDKAPRHIDRNQILGGLRYRNPEFFEP